MRQRLFCVPLVIQFRLCQDSRGRASSTPLRHRIQAIKIMQLIAAVVGASAWEARQRHLTTAQSSIMAGLLRITNHELRATVFPRTQMRRSAGTDSGWYDDRVLFVIHSGYAQDSRGRASSTPLRYRIQAIKIMQLIAAVVGASAWEARQRNLTTASSSIMAGLYEPRTTNHGFSATAFPRIQMRRSAATDSGWYYDRVSLVINSGCTRDSGGLATREPLQIAYRRWE